MAKIELDYIEIDGLLYPNIETGMEHIEGDLGKYGILRLRYLHDHKRSLYRELFLTGKLAQHCKTHIFLFFNRLVDIPKNGVFCRWE